MSRRTWLFAELPAELGDKIICHLQFNNYLIDRDICRMACTSKTLHQQFGETVWHMRVASYLKINEGWVTKDSNIRHLIKTTAIPNGFNFSVYNILVLGSELVPVQFDCVDLKSQKNSCTLSSADEGLIASWKRTVHKVAFGSPRLVPASDPEAAAVLCYPAWARANSFAQYAFGAYLHEIPGVQTRIVSLGHGKTVPMTSELRNSHRVTTEEMELASQYKVEFVVPMPGGRATISGLGRLTLRTAFAGLAAGGSTLPYLSDPHAVKQLLSSLVAGTVQSVRVGMGFDVRNVSFEATPYVSLANRTSLSHASGYDSDDGLVA